jgi:signal transduction histidine kinase
MFHTKDLSSLISGILEATRVEAGEIELESREMNIADFMDTLRSDYAIPLDKELTLIWDYPQDLPYMKTDGNKLRHILQNLINNAVKFTFKGDVTISARCPPTGQSVEFKVADTGEGIPRESLPVVFDMFRQVDSSSTRSFSGVGLGLYIVKRFTELLGGTIEVASESGKGSTFTVRLPLEAEEQGGQDTS